MYMTQEPEIHKLRCTIMEIHDLTVQCTIDWGILV